MTNIVILGAGYAGLAAAVQLAARNVPVTLINGSDRFTERLRLPLAVTGQQVADLRTVLGSMEKLGAVAHGRHYRV